ncbi:MAG: dTDP-4-dehydrorhamnose reductase [Bacteroidetes bacterium]|nr:dTDP-4-dehydrorhamnose reductase [Bacteroidota bacterium]
MVLTRPLILVTGKNGQLGSSLQAIANQFQQFDFLFTGKENLDITKEEIVQFYFKKYKPSFCINAAAYTAVDLAETDQEQASLINIKAVSNLAKACKEFSCIFLHISTDYVFRGDQQRPYLETDITDPVNFYGYTKRAGEEQALAVCAQTFIIRASWLYSEYGKNFVKTMLNLFQTKKEIAVVGDQFGAPTYAKNLSEALLKICSQPIENLLHQAGIYHFSDKGNITWFDFASEIKKQTGTLCHINKITTEEYPTPAKRPHYSVFNTSKFKTNFELEMKDWKNSLASCLHQLGQSG